MERKATLEAGRLIAGQLRKYLNETNHMNDKETIHVDFTEDKGFFSTSFYLTITGQAWAIEKFCANIRSLVD